MSAYNLSMTAGIQEPFHRTPAGAIAISLGLMVPAALESGPLPWSPFFVIYVGLAVGLPLAWGAYRFGPAGEVRWWHWPGSLGLALLSQVAAGLVMAASQSLFGAGAADVAGMFEKMLAASASRWNTSPEAMTAWYLGFILLWAGLGEELFYRGYLQGTIRKRHGAWTAITIAAAIFAIRHYAQMVLLFPGYPWIAATTWVAGAMIIGVVLGWIYERTGSLWIPVATHYLFNLIPVLATLAPASE